VAMRSKGRVCGRSLAGIAGSNPVEGINVCCKCRVSLGRGLWADRSSGGVPPSVVCLSKIKSNNNPVHLQV